MGKTTLAMCRINLLLIFVISFFFTLPVSANKINVDSLINVCNHPTKIDLTAHQKLFDYYSQNNPDLLFENAKQLLEKAIDNGNELAEMLAYFYLADYYSERGSNGLALENLNRAKAYYERVGADFELVEVYNGIGNIHYRRGEYEESVLWYLKSMDKGSKMESLELSNLAKLNLGRSYIELKDTLKGEATILDYIEQVRKLKKAKDLANAYNVIGGYYQGIGDHDLAHHYFNEALVLSMNRGDKRSMAHSYNNLAISYFFQDKVDLAKAYFVKSLNSRLEVGNKVHISESYYNLGDWFLFQDYLDSASYYYQLSYKVAKDAESYGLMADALMAMTEVEKKRGNFDIALNFYEEYIELRESQMLNTRKEDIAVLEFDRLMSDSKRNKVFLDKEKQTGDRLNLSRLQNKWLIIVAVFVLCLGIILLLMRIVSERKRFVSELVTKENSLLESSKNLEQILTNSNARDKRIKNLLIDLLPYTEVENSEQHSIIVLGDEELRLTRKISLNEQLFFYWDAPLTLTESLLLRHYLLVNKDKLVSGDQIDEMLSGQQIIEDYKIQWFLFDANNSKILSKSGLQFFYQGSRNSELVVSTDKSLIFHKEISAEFNQILTNLEKDLKTLSIFSDEMINKLTSDVFSGTEILEKHVLFMLNSTEAN